MIRGFAPLRCAHSPPRYLAQEEGAVAVDWDDLKVFLAVARGESLSRAGRVLKRDAATVGRRVSKLEVDMGLPLFTKSPQGYALTDAGVALDGPMPNGPSRR